MKNVFSIESLKQSKVANLNQHLFETEKKPRQPRKTSKHVIWMGEQLKEWCEAKGYELLTEYKFHDFRKFRFDFAVKEIMTAFEYEGLQSEISGHTTLKGYTKDATKYNLAQREGWKVMRYTVLNYQNIINDLNEIK